MTDRGKGRLVAVVVTHDRLAQLQVTVARLLASPPGELAALVVVNNAGPDEIAAWLATQTDPRLDVLTHERNLGGAGGFESGMRRAMARHNPDWLVLMDDDGRPEPGALAAFHALDLSGWDGVAAAVYYPDGDICEMNRPSLNPFGHPRVFLRTLLRLGGRGGFHLDPRHYRAKTPTPVEITSFVGFFVSARVVEREGYPDASLFVYGEDGVYSYGLHKAGARIGFQPSVRFEHDCSTFAGQRGRFRPIWKVYYYHRNLLLLYRMAAGPVLFWPMLLGVVLPKWVVKVRHHRGERRLFLRLLGRAVRDGLMRRTGTDHAELLRSSGQSSR